MCLYTNRREPYIAKRDIYVIKALWSPDNRQMLTIGRNFPVQLNSLLEGIPKVAKEGILTLVHDRSTFFRDLYYIAEGAIHFYKSIRGANKIGYIYKIAYIPKGASYWLDNVSCTENQEAASTSLFITDIDYKNPKQLKWLNFKSYIKSLFSWMKLNQE